MAGVNCSHQGSGVKLKNDMLQEDQQVGGPFLQLINAVKAFALVVRCLKVKNKWERNDKCERNILRRKRKKNIIKKINKNTHIIEIILKILILSPNDAHGWVRALSPKHTLLWSQQGE